MKTTISIIYAIIFVISWIAYMVAFQLDKKAENKDPFDRYIIPAFVIALVWPISFCITIADLIAIRIKKKNESKNRG